MATDVSGIEDRLKIVAEKDLKKELEALFRPLLDLAHNNCYPGLCRYDPPNKDDGGSMGAFRALNLIKEAMFRDLLPTRQNEAIAAFLDRVNGLQSQLDQLRDSVESQ